MDFSLHAIKFLVDLYDADADIWCKELALLLWPQECLLRNPTRATIGDLAIEKIGGKFSF